MLYSHALWAADEHVGVPLNAAVGVPIYNPATKSYFELFNDNVPPPSNWDAAKTRAATKFYEGVRGRLAVVDSAETHKFIIQNFKLNWREASVWIGLRYWCSVHMLQWEDGLPFSPSDASHFRIWHASWSRTGDNACNEHKSLKTGFAPVYYRNMGGRVRWQAVGAAKYFTLYLVEFVTNGE
jgi:hypothetical protein